MEKSIIVAVCYDIGLEQKPSSHNIFLLKSLIPSLWKKIEVGEW